MKKFAIIILAFLPVLGVADSSQFETAMTLKVRDVPALLSLLNEQLGLRVHTKVLSDYAASIAVGNEYSEGIDVHFRGAVYTITYKISKSEIGEIGLSFGSFNKELAIAICQQMSEYSQINDSARAAKTCRSDSLESISA